MYVTMAARCLPGSHPTIGTFAFVSVGPRSPDCCEEHADYLDVVIGVDDVAPVKEA